MTRRGLAMAAGGVGIGVVATMAGLRLVRTLVVGAPVSETLPVAGAAAALFAIAMAASYLPARRATRVDPLVALRYE